MGIGIGNPDWGLGIGVMIGDWDGGGIGDWNLESDIEIGDLDSQLILKKHFSSKFFVRYFLLHISYIQVPWFGMPATPLRWFSILAYKGMFSQQSVTLVFLVKHCHIANTYIF